MATSESLRRQHGELLREIGEFVRSLSSMRRNEPERAEAALSRLSGKLSVHIEAEMESLRKALSGSLGDSDRDSACRFIMDMEAALASLMLYRRTWGGPVSMRTDPARFRQETRNLFYKVAKMIEREDPGLYSLLDRMRPAA